MDLNKKIELLADSFKSSDNILVAFSGGVDSTFLLYTLKMYSPASVSAVTVKTPYIPSWEVDEASSFCKSFEINHEIIELPVHKSFATNPPDRCYRCKSVLFSRIKDYAGKNGFNIIADGSNADDTKDFRPGMRALKELEIRSPLLESGFTKNEIRNQLKEFGLEIWDKPAYACLLTRLPYDTEINIRDLNIIEESEDFLHKLGFKGARVRLLGNSVRIEVTPEYFNKFLEEDTRIKIIKSFKASGIKFISLDLEGYRMGSMNTK